MVRRFATVLFEYRTKYMTGSRGPAVLDDFTASYGYKFSDGAGYRWPMPESAPQKL